MREAELVHTLMQKEAIIPQALAGIAGLIGAAAPTLGAIGTTLAPSIAGGAAMSAGMYGMDKLLNSGQQPAQPARPVAQPGATPQYQYQHPVTGGQGVRYASARSGKELAFDVGVEAFCKRAGLDAADTEAMILMAKLAAPGTSAYESDLARFGHNALRTISPPAAIASELLSGKDDRSDISPLSTPGSKDNGSSDAGRQYEENSQWWEDAANDWGGSSPTARALLRQGGSFLGALSNPWALAQTTFTTSGRKGFEDARVARGVRKEQASADKDFYKNISGLTPEEQAKKISERNNRVEADSRAKGVVNKRKLEGMTARQRGRELGERFGSNTAAGDRYAARQSGNRGDYNRSHGIAKAPGVNPGGAPATGTTNVPGTYKPPVPSPLPSVRQGTPPVQPMNAKPGLPPPPVAQNAPANLAPPPPPPKLNTLANQQGKRVQDVGARPAQAQPQAGAAAPKPLAPPPPPPTLNTLAKQQGKKV